MLEEWAISYIKVHKHFGGKFISIVGSNNSKKTQ